MNVENGPVTSHQVVGGQGERKRRILSGPLELGELARNHMGLPRPETPTAVHRNTHYLWTRGPPVPGPLNSSAA